VLISVLGGSRHWPARRSRGCDHALLYSFNRGDHAVAGLAMSALSDGGDSVHASERQPASRAGTGSVGAEAGRTGCGMPAQLTT